MTSGSNASESAGSLLSVGVEVIRGFLVTVHFRDVSHIVQGKRAVGIQFVGLFEVAPRLLRLVAIERKYTLKIQPGGTRGFAGFGLHAPLDRVRVVFGNVADRL